MPESIRDIAREVGTDAKQVLAEMAVAACSPIASSDFTFEQRRFVSLWEQIATGIGKRCTVNLCTGRPSAGASFDRNTRVLTVYVERVPGIVKEPLSARALSLLIHELAHWREQDEDAHGSGFHSDAEDVGGAVAAFLLANAEMFKVDGYRS